MQNTDRQVQREAFEAWAALYESISGELDNVYDELIRVRCDMASVLGFSDYIEMIYQRRERYDYDRKDVENFRKEVKETIVPGYVRYRLRTRKNVSVSTVCMITMEALAYPEGNAEPIGLPPRSLLIRH